MLHLSKTAGYAMHALSFIGTAAPKSCLVSEIASKLDLPRPYLAQIINQLTYQGLVTTKRGYRGGVTLAKRPEEISLLEIVKATDGNSPASHCVFGLEKCPLHETCPGHVPWNRVRDQIEELLDKTLLSDVMKSSGSAKSLKKTAGRATAVRRHCPVCERKGMR
jgi:Rrf2 family protein